MSCLFFRILGVFPEVHTHNQTNRATRELSLHDGDFRGLSVPSFALDVGSAHYALLDATLASLITDYESESLGSLYGTIR
jgi:hypothetical protein